VVVLAALFVILAGGIGALLVFNYLTDYASSLVTVPETSTIGPQTRAVSPGTIESAVSEAREKIIPTMVRFLKYKEGEGVGEQAYFEDDVLGYGFCFTSDGWLIAPGQIFAGREIDSVVAEVGTRFFKIEKSLVDKTTGAAFIKVATENLPVAELAEKQYLASGDRVLKLLGPGIFESANILNKQYNPASGSNYLESSEVASGRMLISGNYALGALAVNYSGQIIGLVNGQTDQGVLTLPLYLLEPLVKSLLKEEKLTRPYLGVHYVDLARVHGISADIIHDRNRGALVWSGPEDESAAVLPDSPAHLAGLEKGDIIVSVNDEVVGGSGSLSEILLDYDPQNKLYLEIIRQGEEQVVSVTLGALDSLLK
ncbi:S1C family serine protease, partial [Patescibacteria group bacterium]|nr:S1C family serine protease [Patescibacteria group bacterium]